MRRVIATVAVILPVTLTGCSGNEQDQDAGTPPASSSSSNIDEGSGPAPCAKECSNQEVAASGCDQGRARTVATAVQVDPKRLDGIAGVLELRMADPAVCESIFWARFRPYSGASANWVVSLKIDGRPYEDQASDQGPNVDGYTEGIYAAPGADITYCINQAVGDGDDKVCQSTHINEGGG